MKRKIFNPQFSFKLKKNIFLFFTILSFIPVFCSHLSAEEQHTIPISSSQEGSGYKRSYISSQKTATFALFSIVIFAVVLDSIHHSDGSGGGRRSTSHAHLW